MVRLLKQRKFRFVFGLLIAFGFFWSAFRFGTLAVWFFLILFNLLVLKESLNG